MIRRFAAYWICVIGIARQKIGLTATATEVFLFLIAGTAGLWHPAVAPVMVEPRAVVPDALKIHVSDIGEIDG